MKKTLFLLVGCLLSVSLQAQVMRAEELEKYAKERYGENWTEAAENLSKELSLDKNKSLTYQQVIECGDQTKEQLYIILNHWVTASFNDANSVIKLNDKELGSIIAEGYVDNIAEHLGGVSRYKVSMTPIIKIDIRDKKIRVTYTLQYYNVEKIIGGGSIYLALSNGSTKPQINIEKWGIDTCYPFSEKDQHKAKKTSSKALVMAHAYSNVIMDKIEEAVKHGLVGNENDNW